MVPQPMKWILLLLLSTSVLAAEYERALELPKRTENRVFRDRVKANWLPDDRAFWYRVQTGAKTHEFVLVTAEDGTRRTAGSLSELGLPEGEALRTSTSTIEVRRTVRTGPASKLRFLNRLDADVDLFWINRQGEHIRYDGIRAGAEREQDTFEGHVWLLTSRSGEELACIEAGVVPQTLLIDGKGIPKTQKAEKREKTESPVIKQEEDPGFRSPNGAYVVRAEADPVPRRRITLVESSPPNGLQPELKVLDYLKPGDPLPNPQLVITARDGRKIRVPKQLYPTPFTESGKLEVRWAPDSREFYFDYNQRGHQLYRILAVNPDTGDARVVVEETAETFIDYTQKTWRHWLHGTGEILWMSERDGWCHLWLYDLAAGRVKHQITRGAWPVRKVLHVEEAQRRIWFLASGLREEEDPYHLHLCRVNFDGTGFQRLTEGDGNHHIEFSPNRAFFTDSYSRADLPPVHELRRSRDGSLVCVLEKADASQLLASG